MKTVYCDGTFDLIHYGHLNFFEKCKAFGDKLIVGVISDENVATYKRKPIISTEYRAKMLESMRIVDKVIVDCPFKNITKEFIEEHDIDVVVYASEGGLMTWHNHYSEAIKQNKMRYIEYEDVISTSKIIQRIKNL